MIDKKHRPLLVVLDTNQWDAHTLLRSHLSASLIYLVERHGAKLAVPEVVATEVEEHLVNAYAKTVRDVEQSLRRIRMILGRSPDPTFPSEDAPREALNQRLNELGDLVVRLPVSERHLIDAGRMVLAGLAPNAKGSQQYKDCLIWQAVIELSDGYAILFVTADGGFYADAKSAELHPDLLDTVMGDVHLVRSMEDAVARLQKTAPVLDLAPILNAINAAVRNGVEEIAEQNGMAIEGVNNADASAFVTGRPGETLVVFEMTHDLIGDAGQLARVISSGEAVIVGVAVLSLNLASMETEAYGEAGFESAGRIIFGRGSSNLGARHRQHELRVPAPGRLSLPL